MTKHLRFDIFDLQETKLPLRLINTTNERLVQEHQATPLRVKGEIEDVSSLAPQFHTGNKGNLGAHVANNTYRSAIRLAAVAEWYRYRTVACFVTDKWILSLAVVASAKQDTSAMALLRYTAAEIVAKAVLLLRKVVLKLHWRALIGHKVQWLSSSVSRFNSKVWASNPRLGKVDSAFRLSSGSINEYQTCLGTEN
ncbi:hypothetical protein TNCV_310551 [Trichonephila clavipes]|nr:hypothetical protein TNCV_310551 [Trichonephila clavipes]